MQLKKEFALYFSCGIKSSFFDFESLSYNYQTHQFTDYLVQDHNQDEYKFLPQHRNQENHQHQIERKRLLPR